MANLPPCPYARQYVAARRPCLVRVLDLLPEPAPENQAGYVEATMGWYGFFPGPLDLAPLDLCPACRHGLPAILSGGACLWVSDVGRETETFRTSAGFERYRASVKAEDRERLAPYPRRA